MARYLTLEQRAAIRQRRIVAQGKRLRAWRNTRMLPRGGSGERRRSLLWYDGAGLDSLATLLSDMRSAGIARRAALEVARVEARRHDGSGAQ
jgi:hypothetical protein